MFSKKKRIEMLIQENDTLYKQITDLNDELYKARKDLKDLQEICDKIEKNIASDFDYIILNKGTITNFFVNGVPLKRIWKLDFSQRAGELPRIDFKS